MSGKNTNTATSDTFSSIGDLSNVFNYGLPAGESSLATGATTTAAGVGTLQNATSNLDPVTKYWSDILSGNRTAVMGAVAPTVNAVNDASDARLRQTANMGTSRGGGINSDLQQDQTRRQSEIDNAINQVRPQAAEGLTKAVATKGALGSELTSAGISEQGIGANLLGTSTTAAGSSGSLSLNEQAQSFTQDQALGEGLGSALLLGLSFINP